MVVYMSTSTVRLAFLLGLSLMTAAPATAAAQELAQPAVPLPSPATQRAIAGLVDLIDLELPASVLSDK